MNNGRGKSNDKLRREKECAISIANSSLELLKIDRDKIGIILCEGEENSIDKALYSMIYPDFLIIPVGGCTDVSKLLFRVRKLLPEYKCYGLIDRDAISKTEIKKLREERGIYTTKLPFIENIICIPEVVKILCTLFDKRYDEILKKVRKKLMSMLCKKIRTDLPINIYISDEEIVKRIEISITLEDRVARKLIDDSNILYTLRCKSIASEISDALCIWGRENYYNKIKELIQDEKIGEKLVMSMAKYLPRIP